MRVVLQRVTRAAVSIDGRVVSSIDRGLLVLVGIDGGDNADVVTAAVDKIGGLRVFGDDDAKMNLSVGDVGGQILLVSQFTLLGDMRRGRRPSFSAAAAPHVARPLIDEMAAGFRRMSIPTVQGVFGAGMEVELVNDGPVTLILDFPSTRPG
jgi:D-tyrosyl-tRNA(Tyr) deacylase